MSDLPVLLDRLEQADGPPDPVPSADGWELVLAENVAYLVDDQRRWQALAELRTKVGLAPEQILAAPEAVLRGLPGDRPARPGPHRPVHRVPRRPRPGRQRPARPHQAGPRHSRPLLRRQLPPGPVRRQRPAPRDRPRPPARSPAPPPPRPGRLPAQGPRLPHLPPSPRLPQRRPSPAPVLKAFFTERTVVHDPRTPPDHGRAQPAATSRSSAIPCEPLGTQI
jgi:hypothetical protein